MFTQENLELVVKLLLIAGAINWGLVSALQMDLVANLAAEPFNTYIKMLVGVAGVFAAYQLVMPLFQAQAAKAAEAEKTSEQAPAPETPAVPAL